MRVTVFFGNVLERSRNDLEYLLELLVYWRRKPSWKRIGA
jgi:hypothetical protein